MFVCVSAYVCVVLRLIYICFAELINTDIFEVNVFLNCMEREPLIFLAIYKYTYIVANVSWLR